jgi:dolichol-phosphate mannosyltransferase
VSTTVVVPTFNESGNIKELVTRLTLTLAGCDAEILFVDDSTDDTPDVIREVAESDGLMPVRLLHRPEADRVGGLASAVTAGIAMAGDRVVVMDGDLQHPAELVPELLAGLDHADIVVASRYTGQGDAAGLAGFWRRLVSSSSTLLAQACFPRRVGRVCTDPMTGFFAFHRRAVDLGRLRPRGFKILLEILARHDLEVAELPFAFGERTAGESKASWRNGLAFLYQLASLRMGRMSRFAAVGALGTVVNLVVIWGLLQTGVHYLPAAVVAAEVSILHNFLMQERFVYRDLRTDATASWGRRCALFFGFNNVEALLRLPVLAFLVSGLALHPVPAQALTLAVAFALRFLFVSHVIYGKHRTGATAADPTLAKEYL